MGLWYPRVSSFDLEAYSDSDYAGANLDKKSKTGEAEYVAAANCRGQVLWIQNQMLDYGFNFMNTKIYIDNESTICIVKNPIFHSETKHIAIRHHFIRDAYEKKLIQVLKIHTDANVADLLTKAFDVNRESLERDIDGTEELLLPDLFILWLTKVSTDSAKLIQLGKDSTAIKTLEKIQPRLKNVHVPLDHFPINALTSKVFSFMVKKGKHFSGNVTPLFDSMLVQPTKDEGDTLERQSKPQPIPSPPHLSEDQHETQTDPSPRPSPTTHIPDSILEGSGGNHGGQSSSDRSLSGNEGGMTLQSVYDICISLCTQVTDQAKEIKHLKAQIKKLKKKVKPVITHHKAWMRSVSMKQRLAGKKSLKKQWITNKPEDSTDKLDEGTDKPKVSTDKEEVSTDRPDEGTVDQNEGRSATQTAPTTTTPTIFGDDETIAQVLIIMSQNKEKLKEKEKGVELKDVEETKRPRPTSTRSLLTLKPLPKIDPKDKGKKMIEEED
ncbi:hypothetical protein Tco_0272907 [Tanacetum coccineum]